MAPRIPFALYSDASKVFSEKSGASQLLTLGSLIYQLGRLEQPSLRARRRNDADERKRLLAEITEAESKLKQFLAEKKRCPIRKYLNQTRTGKGVNIRVARLIALLAARTLLYDSPLASLSMVSTTLALLHSPNPAADMVLEYRRVVSRLAIEEGILQVREATVGYFPNIELTPNVLDDLMGGDACCAFVTDSERVAGFRNRMKDRFGKMGSKGMTKEPDEFPSPTPQANVTAKKLYEQLQEIVIGQDAAIKTLACRGMLHLKRAEILRAGEEAGHNECLFFTGPSGSGKTLAAETFGKLVGIPFASFSTTACSGVGYVGMDLAEDSIKKLIRNAGNPSDPLVLEQARYGTLFYDEFTKKRTEAGIYSGRDISGKSVQQEVLRLVEGEMVNLGIRKVDRDFKPVEFNSNGTFFVLAGFMDGLDEILKKLAKKNGSMGFGAAQESVKRGSYLYDALIEFGIIEELVNRLTGVCCFQKLSTDTLLKICLSDQGPIASYNKVLAPAKISLTMKAAQLISGVCYETGLSARGIRTFIGALAEDMIFNDVKKEVLFEESDVQAVIDQRMSADCFNSNSEAR